MLGSFDDKKDYFQREISELFSKFVSSSSSSVLKKSYPVMRSTSSTDTAKLAILRLLV